MSQYNTDIEEQIGSDTMEDIKEPSMYRVLLHNDDYTTMDFVIEILVFVFNKPVEAATRIMLDVHKHGIGLCGIYTYEVAETKVETVEALAREKGFPLKCTMEEDAL
ncbi:MAG: ATP-dependent Clp protease adapter ClpS [Desulfobacteraceae bacterium]|nr:ATP-dependent Clp protease adapter ClpS [Desulfobacteraceae bacterium]